VNVRDLLAMASQRLGGDARLEAELLLAHALGTTRARLYAWPEHEPDAHQHAAFERLDLIHNNLCRLRHELPLGLWLPCENLFDSETNRR